MDILFFGDFLLQKGLITKEQLDRALEYQLKHNKCVGEIALEEKLLDKFQIQKIKEIQKIEDKKFGEVSLDINFLDDKQIDVILDKQKKRNITFGQALLHEGVLGKEEIDEESFEFKKAQKYKRTHIYTELAFCDENRLLHDSHDIFKSLFYRSFQEYVKFKKVDFFVPDKQENIFISQGLNGDIDLDYILAFNKNKLPKFLEIDVEDTEAIIEVFRSFMNDFINRVALELSNRDIIVNKNKKNINLEKYDFSECYLLMFITAECDMSLYIKM